MKRLSTSIRIFLAAAALAPLSLAQTSIPGPGGVGVGHSCSAEDAYTNPTPHLKLGYDYVPVANDDSLRFYVAYSAKVGPVPGSLGNTVNIFVFPLDDDEVLIFGAGYGDPEFWPGNGALYDAALDVANVDLAIRGCMGLEPSEVTVRFVSPHGHGDHINSYFMRELRERHYQIAEITFHQADSPLVFGLPGWTPQDQAAFNPISGGGCFQPIYELDSPLGHIWFFRRSGHTPGAIDMVLDVQNDPGQRIVVRGSLSGGECSGAPPGTMMSISAHGTIFFNGQLMARATVREGETTLDSFESTSPPRLGTTWLSEIDTSDYQGTPELTVIIGYDGLLETGVPTSYGDLLVTTDYFNGILVLESMARATGNGTAYHAVPIANNPALVGLEVYTQAAIMGSAGPQLTNALDLIIGN